MSEKSFEQQQDRLMRKTFRKLEEDKGILTGSAFRKWHYSPFFLYLFMLFSLAPFCVIAYMCVDKEMPYFCLLPFIFPPLSTMVSFTQSHAQIVNKRIDKIVELIEAEKKLEQKCQDSISFLASLESKQKVAGDSTVGSEPV